MTEQELKYLVDRKYETDQELKRVEICALIWELPEIEKECVNRIIDNTDYPYKLTFLDTKLLSKHNEKRCCINTSKIWNKFIRESSCDYICILDTDAFVETGWLTHIMRVFTDHDDAGIVSPVSLNRGVPPEQDLCNDEYWKYKDKKLEFLAPSHISGYCFAVRKQMVEDIGLFDEDFYYFGQDSDYCERVQESNKWKIYICPEAIVNHGKDFKWSLSSHELNEKNTEDWELSIDTKYAQELVQIKKQKRGFDRKLYPWGGAEHQKFLTHNENRKQV